MSAPPCSGSSFAYLSDVFRRIREVEELAVDRGYRVSYAKFRHRPHELPRRRCLRANATALVGGLPGSRATEIGNAPRRARAFDQEQAVTDFAQLQQELYALMSHKHDTRELRLLNVGTNHDHEYHWRFRTPSGQIIMIRIEVEE